MSKPYIPKAGECPMMHGAVDTYGLTDKQVTEWCEKGCCPDCGNFLANKFNKILGGQL